MISPLCVSGNLRAETAMFIAHACAWQVANPEKIQDVLLWPEKYTPTPVARNRVVKLAQSKGVDFLLMVDDDTCPPPEFFEFAVEFLMSHPGAAIGCPYVTSAPSEDVLAFHMSSIQSGTKDTPWKLSRIPREDAARRKGVEKVANIGTGCIMYDMELFKKVDKPYFDYQYNDDHTEVTETEDCFLHRRATFSGKAPLYVSWDHWAVHQKVKACAKPVPLQDSHIEEMYKREARAELEPRIRKEVEDKVRAEIAAAQESIAARSAVLHATPTPAYTYLPGSLRTDAPGAQLTPYAAECRRVIPTYDLAPNLDGSPYPPHVAAEWARTVEGWMAPDELLWLASLASGLPKDATWVEVGSWKGRSTSAVFLAAPKYTTICAVDTWKGSPEHWEHNVTNLYHDFKATCYRLDTLRPIGYCVEPVKLASLEAAAKRFPHPVDVVFLDAAHDFDNVLADIRAWSNKVKPGGLLCGHDRNEAGVKRALAVAFGPGSDLNLQEGPGSIWWVRMPVSNDEAAGNQVHSWLKDAAVEKKDSPPMRFDGILKQLSESNGKETAK